MIRGTWLIILQAACGAFAQQTSWVIDLRDQVVGALYTSQNGDNTSRLVYGHAVDPFDQEEGIVPAAVLVAQGNQDVIAAVNVARQHNLTIAAQGGAHWNIKARSAGNGITVDLSQMRSVVVDPVKQTASVQGGAKGGDILHEAARWGLGLPWGDANVTGMGLALGGGIGLAMREHGLTCDSITGAQIVIANGSFIEVSDAVHPELLEGVRGAGTAFGIVTEITFRLFSGIEDVYAGLLVLPDDANFTNFSFLMDFTAEALSEYPGLGIEVWSYPQQAWLLVNFFGPEPMAEKVALFEQLRQMNPVMDMLVPGASNFTAINDWIGGNTFTTAAKAFILSGLMSQEQFEEGGLDAMVEANAVAMSPAGSILLTDWLGEAVYNTSSFTPFKGAYMHYFWALPGTDTDALFTKAVQMQSILADYTTHFYAYPNLSTDPDPEENLAINVGGDDNLDRLQVLKSLVDPDNMFKNHQLQGLLPAADR